ncbi:MAG: type III-B CRISPR module RAMP protein Cmr4 [Deltaproteobacteria bacterium]|nr:type III-B CRISPR module RAMP protein Cmr4 [Deltaproteobacteria bacterium]
MGGKTFGPIGVLGLYTETALHCGAESGLGYVDLPVQRERHTNFPVIPGSSIKGVLRDEMKGKPGDTGKLSDEEVKKFFGSEDAKTPGSVSFGDGIVAVFPIRSTGVPFHWVTCPFVLERVFRAMGTAWTEKGTPPRDKAWGKGNGELLLEEIHVVKDISKAALFNGGKGQGLGLLLSLLPASNEYQYTRDQFLDRLLVLNDEDFGELVDTGTDVVTRIKLNALGTTVNLKEGVHPEISRKENREGNMFVEELVPPESLFVCPLRAPADTAFDSQKLPVVIRLGGDETIGRGVTRVTFR